MYIHKPYSGWGERSPITSSPVTATNVGTSPKAFLILSFNPFVTVL